jgi:DNA polymerase-3 subunit epsilon
MYAIVDIETTGGNPQFEKITEVAIFIHDGERVVDEYTTLINPEKTIPYFITGLTGITNEMVADAPRFYEVAKKIIELTENKIFVAHNASFDYNFIKNEYKSLGYNFKRDILCTVKLSRKLIPGKKSYSLGNICNDLNINIKDRHRASGDALATVKLFEILLSINNQNGHALLEKHDLGILHPMLDMKKIHDLPESAGVYYLYNDQKEVIYVGKSKDIKSRIMTHLSGANTKTSIKMRKEIADVSYELTGNELIALLLESEEIKKLKPVYNRLQRRTLRNYGIYSFINENGYLSFEICETNSRDQNPENTYESIEYARLTLLKLIEEYHLCQKLCGLYKSQGACFHYELKQCNGACAGKESSDEYNCRAYMALNAISVANENLIIIDKGRNCDEKAVVRISNGKYIGYGFLDYNSITCIESLKECIISRKDNHEVRQIIKGYLKRNKVERLIRG